MLEPRIGWDEGEAWDTGRRVECRNPVISKVDRERLKAGRDGSETFIWLLVQGYDRLVIYKEYTTRVQTCRRIIIIRNINDNNYDDDNGDNDIITKNDNNDNKNKYPYLPFYLYVCFSRE